MPISPLRIATRESPLAMWQAHHVADLLHELGHPTQIVPLVSGGDIDMRPIDATRQVGVFTKRIQQALIDHEGDVAVHSLKDLPTEPNDAFTLAAVPSRETVADALVSPSNFEIKTLPPSATVGTGSRRRAAQLLSLRPDLNVQPIRGNVQTRLSKLQSGEFDAIVLAEAGLLRLKMDALPRTRLPLDQMLPAPGQGALGIEVRSDDAAAYDALRLINDPTAEACVIAERTVLSRLHGGCLAPIAAHAQCIDGKLNLRVIVLSPDGGDRLDSARSLDWTVPSDSTHRHAKTIDLDEVRVFANSVSDDLIDRGAAELINAGRTDPA